MKTSSVKTLPILLILILSTANVSYSQKLEKFCEVIINKRVWNDGYKVDGMDYGQTYFTFKDEIVSRSLDSIMNIKNISGSVVILNYMSKKDWKLAASYSEVINSSSDLNAIHLLFKREFDASEILEKK